MRRLLWVLDWSLGKQPNPVLQGASRHAMGMSAWRSPHQPLPQRGLVHWRLTHGALPMKSFRPPNSHFAAPGEVMVPWNEPEVKPVVRLIRRSTVKLPWAPANRPVPPAMVLISVMLETPGVAVGSLDPATVE